MGLIRSRKDPGSATETPAPVAAPPVSDPPGAKRQGGDEAKSRDRKGPRPSAHDGASEGAPQHKGMPLGEMLVSAGAISSDQLHDALTQQSASGQRLGFVLVELGLLSERDLAQALADQLNMEVVDLRHIEVDEELISLLPETMARQLKAVPIRRDGGRIEVAVGDPLERELTTRLVAALEVPVRLVVGAVSDIERMIDSVYRSTSKVDDAVRLFEERMEQRRQALAEPQTQAVVDERAPIVQVVNLILEQAVRDRASDVHLEPQADSLRVRVRTDGALHELITLPGSMSQSLASRIKVMAEMNIVERRRPQDGQFTISIAGRDLDVRVSTTSTVFGEKCVLRLLDKTRALYQLSELGMAADAHERYADLIRSPYGMMICAGPTGSGKTTTLYATLSEINRSEINVMTIEDPVEYVFPSINQIQINEQAGITFATGLRSILRQDPDSILVGEIRDVDTARIAVQAALTGHFVMSSIHATDTTSALHRFLDMGIEPFLIASSLLGIVGQRLVRRICPHCIEPYVPTPDERTFFERGGGDTAKQEFYAGSGCNFCGQTGYFERIGIYEVLRVTDEMKQMIVENAAHETIRRLAISQGMKTLRDQAIRFVSEDKTTIAEVLRTVYVL